MFRRKSFERELVDACGISRAVDFAGLKAEVERYRGTRIEIVEDAQFNGERVCGAWVGDGRFDTVYVPEEGRPEMKFFIACHEFGHMLDEPLRIEDMTPPDPKIEEFIGTVMNPGRRVAYAFTRMNMSTERERRAEAIGDQLALRIFRSQRMNATRDYNFDRVFG